MGLYNEITLFKRVNSERSVEDEIDFDDRDWMLNRFMVKSTSLSKPDNVNRYWSSVNNKFVDTSLGGNIAINPAPQFTRYADLRIKGRRNDRNDVSINNLNGSLGMGRYYGESIEDNATDVFLTMGVPKFNNMLSFILNSIDYRQAIIANSGRSPLAYDAGRTWGKLVIFIAFPVISTLLWITNKVSGFLLGPGRFSYYYMEPAMVQYWSGVNSIVNMFSTELGITTPALMSDKTDPDMIGTPVKVDQEDLNFIRQYIPDIVNDKNYIDVMAVATKAQRMANRQFLDEMEMYKKGEIKEDDFIGLVKKDVDFHKVSQSTFTSWVNELSLSKDLYKKETFEDSAPVDENGNLSTNKFTAADNGQLPISKRKIDTPTYLQQFKSSFDATVREGAQYLVFRVDNPGSVTESFRNETGDIPLEGAVKSISQKVKNIEFSTAGGNILPGVDDILKYTKDVVHGALDGVTLGLSNALTVLEGGGNFELPKKWNDSSVTFPSITLKTKLISPYNHPLAKLQNIYLPLACILQAALPRSVGPSSYTSPFLVSMFMRGRQHITLGMITSLTVTRGTANLPFDSQMRPNAIDVSFTVTDFSKVLASPTPQGLFDPLNVQYNDEAPMNKYIASLSGRSLFNTVNSFSKAKLRVARLVNNLEFAFSPNALGMRVGDMAPDFYKALMTNKSLDYSDNF